MLPEIGLGTWRYLGDPAIIHRSLELGSFLIDTAESYGTEQSIGSAIQGRRDQYFIATKVSPENLRFNDVCEAADNSLNRLGTDWIDLYQIHWPNQAISIGETMKAMALLVNTNKVRYVGVSNFSVQQFREAQDALGDIPLVCNQVEYNLFNQEIRDEFLPFSSANKITVMAYSPLAQGRIDGELEARPKLAKVLDEIAHLTQMTRAQVLLAWCAHLPHVITIPQSNNIQRITENVAALDHPLTDEQYAALSDLSR